MSTQKELCIFISYRRENGGIAYANILNERLLELGIKCFFDIRSMHGYNRNFESEIEKNIDNSDYVVVLLQNGSLTEREGTDYFLNEIRYANKKGKELCLLPIGNKFLWEQQTNVPGDLNFLRKLNLCTPFVIEDISSSIRALLDIIGEDAHRQMMYYNIRSSAQISTPVLQKTSDVYCINMGERWRGAVRVSLMAIGCSSVVNQYSPLIKTKIGEGVKFRFLAIDPNGESASDVMKNKFNSKGHSRVLSQNYETMVRNIRDMHVSDESLEYRLTSDHITFTMHWVECANDNDSYIYIEFLPIYASGVIHSLNNAIIVKRNDPVYSFYVDQFELCWGKARAGIEKSRCDGCEFCFPPEEDDKYILCDTVYWRIYFANNQNYPGRCIIPLHRHCASLSEITDWEMEDFQNIVKMLETIWKEKLGATNFNWTCLMNGGYAKKPYTPHVHFHFIPRFDKPFEAPSGEFVDEKFGDHYVLSTEYQLSESDRAFLCEKLKKQIAEYRSSNR